MTTPREIHVAPGPSAANCLQSGLGLAPESVLVCNDVLSNGPLPRLDSLEDWRAVREAYLNLLYGEDAPLTLAEQDRDLFTNAERLRDAHVITLWIGTGLAEQLLMTWLVALLMRMGLDPGKLRIMQFERVRNHAIVSVGVLHPAEFTKHPDPITLGDGALREAIESWNAVTASDPQALLDMLSTGERSLPLLNRSLGALLYRYPSAQTGLNAWEQLLLQYVQSEGPEAPRAIGSTMGHDLAFPDWIGDGYLFHRILRLGDTTLPKPLLVITGETRTYRGMSLQLTEIGVSLLNGNGNAVEWNGIDDWIGGVHLTSHEGRVWFHKDGTLARHSG